MAAILRGLRGLVGQPQTLVDTDLSLPAQQLAGLADGQARPVDLTEPRFGQLRLEPFVPRRRGELLDDLQDRRLLLGAEVDRSRDVAAGGSDEPLDDIAD